jgi:hypothetical protein
MLPGRSAILFTGAAALALALPVLGSGCGSEPAEFDKAASYTPEALAQELIFRYRALKPDAKTSIRNAGSRVSAAAAAARTKAEKKAIDRTKKNSGTTTIDDLLDDIKSKITLIPGAAPPETIKKMIETISSDGSLSASEKKALTDLVGRLAD